jgi:hypothetical protein
MALSGSTDYALTGLGLVREAMDIVGVRAEGMELSDYDLQQGLTTLNLMLKSWSVKLHLWLKTEGTIVPLASTASYTLAAKPYKILSIRSRVSSVDATLEALSREEYFELPTKSATGTPTSYYFDPQRASGTVYLWPTPDTTFAASGSLLYTYARQIQDVDAKENDLDLPQEWTEALVYSLADRLAIKYDAMGAQKRADIKERAAILYDGLTAFDQEDGSLYLSPA